MKQPAGRRLGALLREAVANAPPAVRRAPVDPWRVRRTVTVVVDGVPHGTFVELTHRRTAAIRLIRAAADALATASIDYPGPAATTLSAFPDDSEATIRGRFLEVLEEV